MSLHTYIQYNDNTLAIQLRLKFWFPQSHFVSKVHENEIASTKILGEVGRREYYNI